MAQRAARGPLAPITLDDPGDPTGRDVEIAVSHCSVCHSDVHLLDGEWGAQAFPFVPGHEVVGRVVRRGPDASVALGAWVGLGWQAGCCGQCLACTTGREHLCTGGKVRTCVKRQGGFATRVRADARFVFELPEGLDRATAAPLLCAGLTVFSPLERFGVTTGAGGRGRRRGPRSPRGVLRGGAGGRGGGLRS